MKTLCAAVLAFEAIIVLLAIPVAIVVQHVNPTVGITVGGIFVIACFALSGLQRRSWGLAAGWVVQVVIILTGFVVPTMFFLGAVFAVLWFFAIRVGSQTDVLKAEQEAAEKAT